MVHVKPRHAAAFAVIGWYLMMPTISVEKLPNGSARPHLDDSANLSAWENLGAFDSAVECNQRQATHGRKSNRILVRRHQVRILRLFGLE
jgi:hypothetical protein